MNAVLVVGLGNPLMGDDGVGWHVAERLGGDPRLPAGVEVVRGGTDLLRYADRIAESSSAIVIDALLDEGEPGAVSVFDDALGRLENRQDDVHCLSAVQAIQLLRLTVSAPIRLLGISVRGTTVEAGLSPGLAARLPAIIDRVLAELADP